MSITKQKYKSLRPTAIQKTGTPLAEMFNSKEDHKQNSQQFFPAEQLPVINLLREILQELKEINKKLR